MANELKIACAAREIARELDDLPVGSPYPYGEGFVFKGDGKTPCCAIGHVIHKAGLSNLVTTGSERLQDGILAFRSSTEAIQDVLGKEYLPRDVITAIGHVVEANDGDQKPQEVAQALFEVANALEEIAAPVEET